MGEAAGIDPNGYPSLLGYVRAGTETGAGSNLRKVDLQTLTSDIGGTTFTLGAVVVSDVAGGGGGGGGNVVQSTRAINQTTDAWYVSQVNAAGVSLTDPVDQGDSGGTAWNVALSGTDNTVQVGNFPTSVAVNGATGNISVANFPTSVAVNGATGNVSVANFPTSVAVNGATGNVSVANFPTSVAVNGITGSVSVDVTNAPDVAVTNTPDVGVTNFPASQAVSVSNSPGVTQGNSGLTAWNVVLSGTDNVVQVTGGVGVTASNLDIRDLDSAQDSVAVEPGSSELAVDVTNDESDPAVYVNTYAGTPLVKHQAKTSAAEAEVIAAPGSGFQIVVLSISVGNSSSTPTVVTLVDDDDATNTWVMPASIEGGGYTHRFSKGWEITENQALRASNTGGGLSTIYINIEYIIRSV